MSKVETRLKHKSLDGGIDALKKRTVPGGVKVGVLSGTGEHPNSTGGQTIAEIAFWNEFGTSIRFGRSGGERIIVPERPFLRSTLKENRTEYNNLIEKLLKGMLLNKIKVAKAEGILGLTVQKDVRNKITSLKTPPNSPATIEKKKSSNPLLDTGALRSAINWKAARRERF